MAIVQISQIQIRRGLQQDLPQLASAEMGWTLDTRRLYIGNGTIQEGAPTEGVTEILTQYSNFLSTIPNYVFSGTDSGYTSQTGPSTLTPINRTLQSVLDDIVSVRDFGATGNGVTDDTAAITRAIQQIYPSSLNPTYANVRRTIKFPAGTYLITSPIAVPPNCVLIGDGKNNTVITTVTGGVILTSDALFQTGGTIGNLDALPPSYILISNMRLETAGGTTSVAQIDSANDIIFDRVYFSGPASVTNLVATGATSSTVTESKAVTFNGCVFDGGAHGFAATNTSIGVRIANSSFLNNVTNGINVTSSLSGLVSENNYFDTTVSTAIANLSGNNYSYGDVVAGSTVEGGIYSGSAKFGAGQTVSLSTGPNSIRVLATGAGSIDYSIVNAAGNYRTGTLRYNNSNGILSFDDEYSEPRLSTNANLFANAGGYLTCSVTSDSTLKYNIKQFI